MHLRFESLKFLISYILKFKKFFITSFLLAVFLTLLQLPMPLASKYLIDKLIPAKKIKLINILGIALAGYVVISALTWVVYNYLTALFRLRVVNLIRFDLFKKVLKLPIIFFEKNETGYIATRISDEVLSLSGIIGNFFSTLIINSLTLVVGILGVFFIHKKLALIVYSILPIYLFATKVFNKNIYQKSLIVREANAQNKRLLIDFLNNVIIAKIHSAIPFALNKYNSSLEEVLDKEMRFTLINSLAFASTRIISNLAPLTLLWYGSLEIVKGRMSLGGLVAFNSFIGYIFTPAQQILNTIYQFQNARSSIRRIREIFGLKEENSGKLCKKLKGKIEVVNLNFSLNGKKILENLNIKINEGEMVAIIGASGVGKTTLLKILAGLYSIERNKVFIDGVDINDYDKEHYRTQVIYVPQIPSVFSLTLFENLALGENFTEQNILDALKMVKGDFVKALKDGLRTKCLEKGSNFSGGQLQRISLARGLIRNPKILLLDEVTAHVDKNTERIIIENLLKMKGRTTILFVGHRLVNAEIFDKIIQI